jgi:hypothetical protein
MYQSIINDTIYDHITPLKGQQITVKPLKVRFHGM